MLIDTEVVRNGKWISISDTQPIEGEIAIETTDGYGYYCYKLTHIVREDADILIQDTEDEGKANEKRVGFNKALKEYGVPPYFKVKQVLEE